MDLRVIEPDANHPDYAESNDEESFHGRMPLIYDRPNSTLYLGGPDWTHGQTAIHHGLPYKGDNHLHGYIGGGKYWGSGALNWYGGTQPTPEEHKTVGDAMETLFPGIQTRHQPADPDDWTDDI